MTTTGRERATAHLRAAAETIDNVFEALDRLAGELDRLSALNVDDGGDVIATALAALAAAGGVDAALVEVREAASAALAYTNKRQLSLDAGVRQALLFPPAPAAERPDGARPVSRGGDVSDVTGEAAGPGDN